MSKKTQLTEKEIRLLVADNKTKRAIKALEPYFDQYDLPDLQDSFSVLAGKWEAYQQKEQLGSASFESLNEEKSRIDIALLKMSRSLFEQLSLTAQGADPANQQQLSASGIREDKFKMQVLWLLIFSKLIIIGAILFFLSVDAFSNDQALAIFAMILPVLSVYLGLIYDDFIGNRYVTNKEQLSPYIKNNVRWFTYFAFVLYLVLTLIVIKNQAAGMYCDEWAPVAGDLQQGISEELAQKYCSGLTTLGKWMGFIEAGLGAYIGKVVLALFKKEK